MDKNDLISRSALLEEVIRVEGDLHMPNGKVMHVESIPVAFVVEAPAIDPEELRPRGKWEMKTIQCCYVLCCSECGFDGLGAGNTFCPHCGAKMEV